MAKFLIPSDGRTAAAVIGDPVMHSLSPTIYNAAFVYDQVNWSYSAVNVTTEQVSGGIGGEGQQLGFFCWGYNVTAELAIDRALAKDASGTGG